MGAGHHHHEHEPDAPPPGSTIHLTSVGVDVGSATTQVVVSDLVLEARGTLVSTGYEVVERTLRHQSPPALTPYAAPGVIDEAQVRAMLAEAYAAAGIVAGDVDTGALIVTGEAARTRNAEAVAEAVSELAGSFVCIAAGPHLEARLAAHGSGAVELSRAHPGEVLLHVDVGGGTTKIVFLRDGEVLEAAAVNVGGRMLVVDADERVVSATEGLRRHARALGLDVTPGVRLPAEGRAWLARSLAHDLLGFVQGAARPADEVADEPITGPPRFIGEVDLLSYSGGVAAYITGEEDRDLLDLGIHLGPAICDALATIDARLAPLTGGIRATVLGAGQFTTQVSGMTTHHAVDGLPQRGMRVVPHVVPGEELVAEQVAARVAASFAQVDLVPGEHPALLAVRWCGLPTYARLSAFADGLAEVLADATAGAVVGVAFDHDLAATIGRMLDERGPDLAVLVVDEVDLEAFDLVDVGAPVSDPPVLPVTVRRIQAGPLGAQAPRYDLVMSSG